MIRLMSRFSVRANLMAIFGLILCGVAAMGLFSLQKISTLGAYTTEIATNWLPSVEVIGRMAEHMEAYRRLQAGMVMAPDGPSRRALQAEAAESLAAFTKARQEYEPMITPGEERSLADYFTHKWNDYLALTVGLGAAASTPDAEALFRSAKPLFDQVAKAILADAQLNTRQGVHVGEAAVAAVRTGRSGIEIALGLLAALCLGAGYLLVNGLSVPIAGMTDAMRRLAAQDLAVQVPGLGQGGEIGTMASAVQVFKENMVEADRLSAEQAALHASQASRSARVSSLVQAFEAKAGGLAQAVAQASSTMERTARSMSGTATRTNQQAATVAAAAEEASAGVQTVASAAEELAASIGEISKQVAQSATITTRAVDETRRTDAIVRELSEGAQKIGQVVELIASIAGQTNLLALNATIEAARAGDAGKGFAVVASEVKGLAGQTARATEQIGAQVSHIQAATRDAVEAIKGIGNTISEVSGIAASIASAVEQQGAATAEIARNVQQTASSTQEVTTNITGVSEAANVAGDAAREVLELAGQLSRHADNLSQEVVTFATNLRAA